ERGLTKAPAYVPPNLLNPGFVWRQLPAQARSLANVLKRRRDADVRKFTDYPKSYSLAGMVREAFRLRRNLWRIREHKFVETPPVEPFIFFGLHMQPESSIDVFAHFFANQLRVIELLSRSLPPTHSLLVKLHKSDITNYSLEFLAQLSRFPGVQIVAGHANA